MAKAQLLEHCGKKFQYARLYKITDDRGFNTTFLYTSPCPECFKDIIGYRDIDIYGEIRTAEGFATAHKKLSEYFQRLIDSGIAVYTTTDTGVKRPTHGCPLGVSEYTLKSGQAHYILKFLKTLQRFRIPA